MPLWSTGPWVMGELLFASFVPTRCLVVLRRKSEVVEMKGVISSPRGCRSTLLNLEENQAGPISHILILSLAQCLFR